MLPRYEYAAVGELVHLTSTPAGNTFSDLPEAAQFLGRRRTVARRERSSTYTPRTNGNRFAAGLGACVAREQS